MSHDPYDFDRSDRAWDAVRFAARLVAVAGLLGILAGVCQGCGASALERHAMAAKGLRGGLDVAATAIEAACDPDVVERREDAPERARVCLRTIETHDAARAAWLTYVSALVLAAESEAGDVDLLSLIPIARSLVALYREIGGAVQSFGGEPLPLPALLEAL